MAKIITSIILSAIATIPVYAQEQADTLKTQELNEVVVEARNQRLGAEVSTYIPNGKAEERFTDCRRFIESYGYPSTEDFA